MLIYTPDCVVCPNHEVVVLQTRIGIDPYLGSVANYTSYSNPPAPPVSTNFLDILFFPSILPLPPLLAFKVVAPFSCTRSPPPLMARSAVHLDVACTHLLPASTTRPCAPRRMREPATVSRLWDLPLPLPWPAFRSLSSPGWVYP